MKALIIVGMLGSVASLTSFLSTHHRFFDLLSHFRIQFIVLVGLALFLALLGKRFVVSLIILTCLAMHTFDAWRLLKPAVQPSSGSGPTVRVMTSNLQVGNSQHDVHVDHIEDVSPDVVVFQEYTFEWQKALGAQLSAYPFRIEVPTHHAFGIALYSKLPIMDSEVFHFMRDTRKSINATVNFNGESLRIIGTHPPPPLSTGLYDTRNQHLKKLSALAVQSDERVVVVGDLNVSTWSSHFQNFLNAGQLIDGRRGHGVLPTWPGDRLPLQIPIDHILIGRDLQTLTMQTGEELGSDHKSLWADIQLQ